MSKEAKELAKQRAELEAALGAERVVAQGHGYTPSPLVSPKPAKVGSVELSDQSHAQSSGAWDFPLYALGCVHVCLGGSMYAWGTQCMLGGPNVGRCIEDIHEAALGIWLLSCLYT